MVSASVIGAESPAVSSYRRRALLAAIAIVSLLGVLPALLVLSHLQIPAVAFPRTLSDPSRLVSIDVPAGWYDRTGDPRSIVRTDSEGLNVEPDLSATTVNPGRGRVSHFTVVISVGPLGKTSDQIHQAAVGTQQTRYGVRGATTRSAAGGLSTTMSVPGQVLDIDMTTSDATAVVRTVTTPDFAVTMFGYTDLQDDPDGTKLLALLEAARIA